MRIPRILEISQYGSISQAIEMRQKVIMGILNFSSERPNIEVKNQYFLVIIAYKNMNPNEKYIKKNPV